MPGVAERDPATSPAGNSVAYFSDESGEYALHFRTADGTGAVRKLAQIDFAGLDQRIVALDLPVARYVALSPAEAGSLSASADGRKILFARHGERLLAPNSTRCSRK